LAKGAGEKNRSVQIEKSDCDRWKNGFPRPFSAILYIQPDGVRIKSHPSDSGGRQKGDRAEEHKHGERGTIRALKEVKDMGIIVEEVVTDGHTSIAKMMS
jgi:hypothetical protein